MLTRAGEHLTEVERDKRLRALKGNRHGHRDWLIGLVIYRHGFGGIAHAVTGRSTPH